MIDVRILTTHDAALFGNVADDVFDEPINPEYLAAFLADPRHHIAVGIDDGDGRSGAQPASEREASKMSEDEEESARKPRRRGQRFTGSVSDSRENGRPRSLLSASYCEHGVEGSSVGLDRSYSL